MVTDPHQPDNEPNDEPSDAALIAAHVDGDPDAFALLFARHRDRLWAVALRTTGDPEVAADGLQDALVSAFRRAGTYRSEAKVTTWLHRIVVNACLDRLRSAKVRRSEPLPEDLDRLETDLATAGVDQPTGSSRPSVDPAEHAVAQERRRAVMSALSQLAPEQRAAVVLVDMEGYSVAEVAAILDCAPGTVKSRCSRARSRLAVLLADHLDRPDQAPQRREQDHPDTSARSGNPSGAVDVRSVTRRGPPPDAAAD